MKIVVMGQGYVGLPLAMAAVKAGYYVVGYEPDRSRYQRLYDADSYIEDVPSHELRNALLSDQYTPAFDESELSGFDVAVITVPTPLRKGEPDLSYVKAATTTLGPHLKAGATVILESTTYPGTTRDVVVPLLEILSEMIAGQDFHVGFSPERIDPGNPSWTFENTPKIVSGLTEKCLTRVALFYGEVTEHVVVARSLEEAELAKVFENTYRQVNIALVNELQRHARVLSVDVYNVLQLCGTKPFGFTKFMPGPGVGGHCISCDPVYLTHHLRTEYGASFRMVELAQEINESQPAYVVQRLQDALNDQLGKALKGARILALGLAYKAGTADVRESPAAEVVRLLRTKGAYVDAVDPHVETGSFPGHYQEIGDIGDYDAVVLLTAHDGFDLTEVAYKANYVLDTRGVLPSGDNIERL